MKAVFFDYNINFGGAPKGSIGLCANLIENGEDVVIYDVYGKNKKYIDLINENHIGFRVVIPEAKKVYIGGAGKVSRALNMLFWLPDFLKIVFRTRQLFKQDKINLVWVNNEKSLVTVTIAALGLRTKKILYHRGWAAPETIGVVFRFFINWQCDALIGHSQATVKNLQTLFPNKKHFYVPNAVDLENTPATHINKPENQNYIVLLPAARPVYEKGHHTAVLALAKLVEQGMHNIDLHFPGETAVGVSNKYISDLKELISKHNLADKVKFVGWLDSLEPAMQQADIVILPSHTEGFPRVIIESMLLSTPVIATPVGGIPEAIVHNETGFIIDIDDADMLAEAISSLLSNPELGVNMALEAYNFAINNFSKAKQLEAIKKAFYEVLAHDK